MKKILNKDISRVVEDMLSGYVYAYQHVYERIGQYNAIRYKNHRKNKVALVIGGGSGHEPLFTGFCGAGLADAVACGNICASPNPNLIYQTAKSVESGEGVIFLYGCYAGDNLNFDMAEEICRKNGMKTAHVRVWDDCTSAPKERIQDRRGIAGDVFVIKIAGAACDAGLPLDEVLRITEKARDNINTVGLATYPGTLPGNTEPTFALGEDEIEFGMGLHGEPGIERTKMTCAEDLVSRMYGIIKEEMQLKKEDPIAVLINGLGATPLLELNTAYYDLYQLLQRDNILVHDAEIKTYCTCMEMCGFSITILKLDEELKRYYDAPCYSPYYAKGSVSIHIDNDLTENSELDTAHKDAEMPAEIKRSREGSLDQLNVEDSKNMLLYIAKKVIENKELLTKVDSAIGDGDHGIGMEVGMRSVQKRLSHLKTDDVYEVFKAAGDAMMMSMGGASGIIFGSLFLEGAKGVEPKEIINAEDFLEMQKKSLNAIQERGKAQVGDKTMVDALYKAVEEMKQNVQTGFLKMAVAGEQGAKIGMEDTKNYIAKFGRAKFLMERSLGHQDAGATSVWLIFQAIREYMEGNI